MGSSKDYANVAEWKTKDTGYHTGDMVRYKDNIFRAAYWAGKEPGVDPGWSLYDELYDQTSPNPTTTAKIIGYLPTWRTDLDYGNAVVYQNITHGIIAFLNFDETKLGELDQTSVKAVTAIVQQVVTSAHKAGTYISVAIGGAVDYGFLNLLTAVGSNASDARLDKAVQNVTQFVQDNALDGVDLDLECWWDKNGDASKDQGGRDKSKGPHPAGSALLAFAQKVKAALPGKLVSATLFATSWYGNAYDPKLADYVDWLSIMSYDLTGSWNQTPVGPHTALNKIRKQDQYKDEQQGPWPTTARGPSKDSTPMDDNPIFSVEDSLWYWSNPFFVNWQGEGQKVARNKLVAGVPLYGYDFAYIKDKDPESGQTPPGYKVLRYKELVQQFPAASTAANANIKVSGNTPRPSFVSAPGTYPYAHNIYLETPDTAVAKLKFLNQLGLQGVIVWEMSNEVWDDGKSIVKALYKASGNPATRPALPAPTFAKPPVQSGDLNAPTGQSEHTLNHGTNGTPGIAVFHDILFAVHEGYQANTAFSHAPTGEIWYTGFKDGKWESPTDTKTPYGTTGAPALIVYKDTLYAFHEGDHEKGDLWFATAKFESGKLVWKGDTNTGFGTTGAPALAIYHDQLYCVHLGQRGSDALWWARYDGTKWTQSDTALMDQKAAAPPRLAVYNDKLYCVFQGAANGQFWYVVYDGKSWTTGNKTSYATYGAPALAAYNGKLHAFHEGYQTYLGGDGGIQGPRSYKLWYTARDDRDWTTPKDTDTGFGITDPPSLVVSGNKLYCVHGGRGGSGEIWWFSVDGDNRSGDAQLNGTTASPPALVEFGGELYCVYQKAGSDGYIAWTTLPFNSHADHPDNPDDKWIEVRGANSYCYYELDSLATQSQHIETSKTINVDAAAPYITAVLIKNEDSIDFPTGAMLKITGPDGVAFDHDTDTDSLQIILSGQSLQGLVIEAPKAGDYQVTLSVPPGVEFHFEFQTMPSQSVADTIDNALTSAYASSSQQLQKRGPGSQVDLRNVEYLAIAAIVQLATQAGRWKKGGPKYVEKTGGMSSNWAGSYVGLARNNKSPKRSAQQLFDKHEIGEEIGDTTDRPLLLEEDQTIVKVYVILYNDTYAWIPIKHTINYYNRTRQPYSAGCPQFFGGNLETDDASIDSIKTQLILEVLQESRGTLALLASATPEQLLLVPEGPESKRLYVFFASRNPGSWTELGQQISIHINFPDPDIVMQWAGNISDDALYGAGRRDWLETMRVQQIRRRDFVGVQADHRLDLLISLTVAPGARSDQFRESHTAQAFQLFFAKWLA
jgi:GH18 family chitinase